jgi:hypothetical protein
MHETLDPAQVLEYNCLTMTNTNNTGAFLPTTYVAIASKPVAAPLAPHRMDRTLAGPSATVLAAQLLAIVAPIAALFTAVALWA